MTPQASARPLVAVRMDLSSHGRSALPSRLRAAAWNSALSGLLCTLFINASVAGEASEDPQLSLERMATAAQSLNYDGTFVYRNGATMQSMRIIHRAGGQGERERLVALSGAAREVIRDPERVTCILPDRQSVVVAKSRPRQFPHSKLFESGPGFAKYYSLKIQRGERIAGRHTKLLSVAPPRSLPLRLSPVDGSRLESVAQVRAHQRTR